MRIGGPSQAYQGYRKSTDLSASSRTFGQVMQTKAQDHYFPKYTDDIVKMMEDCIDRFVKGVIGDGIDQMTGAAEK